METGGVWRYSVWEELTCTNHSTALCTFLKPSLHYNGSTQSKECAHLML